MKVDWSKVLEAASGDVRRLSHVVRYSSIPISVPENVAEHSYWVSLYAILIHRTLRPKDTTLVAPILLKALIHDLPECVTGDVVRTFKYSSTSLKDEIDKAEAGIIQTFSEPVFNLYALLDDLAKDHESYIKDVVKAADFMSLHQYMLREIRRNGEIRPYYARMESDLKNMADSLISPKKYIGPYYPNELSDLYKAMLKMAKKVRANT